MGCLLALLAAISPRLALVLVWIFTNLVDRAFTGFLLPLLGLIFLPLTTLLYVLAYQPLVGVSGWGWVLVIVGLLFDLGSYGGGAFGRRR
jgi:CDP-diglyceride synthetase